MVGTSIGAARASSTQENPPAAANAAPADIFRASRREKSMGMATSPPIGFSETRKRKKRKRQIPLAHAQICHRNHAMAIVRLGKEYGYCSLSRKSS
jgi:hypothetical protein